MKSIQYTIRNIPEPVDKALRQQARKQGQSFNETVVKALKKATGSTNKSVAFHDLDWFIGAGKTTNQERAAQKWLDSLPKDLDK